MKQVKIGKDAAQELEEAAAWYESEQKGLGIRLISAFEHGIQLLHEPNPPLIPVQGEAGGKGAKKLILHKFPFSVIVYEMEDTVAVVALSHHSRKPGYWKLRVAS
jgi:toxin ParE1/3/4